MVKVSSNQERVAVNVCSLLHDIDMKRNPFRYRQRRPNVSQKYLAPVLPISFNDDQTFDLNKARQCRDLISLLAESNHHNFSSRTTDDVPIILDSGGLFLRNDQQ